MPAANVGVFAVNNARKAGDNFFTGAAGGRGPGQVRSGALEGSSADPVKAMTDMIEAQRAFQLASKAITTQDQMLQIANQVRRA